MRECSAFNKSLIEVHSDWDADKVCPDKEEPDTSSSVDDIKSVEHKYVPGTIYKAYHLRRLEDLSSTWVYNYIRNVIYAIAHRRNGVKDFDDNNPVLVAFRGSDNEILTYNDIRLEETSSRKYSSIEVSKARDILPYCLRRLHDQSKRCKISLISIIIAYVKADKDLKRRQNSVNKTYKTKVSSQDLLRFGVCGMNVDGTMTGYLPDNANSTNARYKEAKEWVLRYRVDEFSADMDALLQNAKVLGVDLSEENPYDYQEDFITNMCVSYLSDNRTYLQRRNMFYSERVVTQIKNMNLSMNDQVIDETPEFKDPVKDILRAQWIFNNVSNATNKFLYRKMEYDNALLDETVERDVLLEINLLLARYGAVMKFNLSVDNTTVVNNYRAFSKSRMLKLIFTFLNLGNSIWCVHEAGYLVSYKSPVSVNVIKVSDMSEVLNLYMKKNMGWTELTQNLITEVRA